MGVMVEAGMGRLRKGGVDGRVVIRWVERGMAHLQCSGCDRPTG